MVPVSTLQIALPGSLSLTRRNNKGAASNPPETFSALDVSGEQKPVADRFPVETNECAPMSSWSGESQSRRSPCSSSPGPRSRLTG